MTPDRLRRGLAAAAAALALTAAAGACGGGGGDNKDASSGTTRRTGTTFHGDPNRVCTIITKSDVEAAIGGQVAAGQGTTGTTCRYTVSGGKDDQAVFVVISDQPANKEVFDRSLQQPGVEPLPGVGDKAFVRTGADGVQAFVLKGNKIVLLVLNTGKPPAAMTDAAKKLAQTAANKA